MKKPYIELLKDPRWQKKRLEVMQRDEFKCRICKDGSRTLHVHHQYYLPNHDPWEYDGFQLVTLCELCHTSEEAWKASDDDLKNALLDLGASRMVINALAMAIFSTFADSDVDIDEEIRNRFIEPLKKFGTPEDK